MSASNRETITNNQIDYGELPNGWMRATMEGFNELKYGKSLAAKSRDNMIYPVIGSNGRIVSHATPHSVSSKASKSIGDLDQSILFKAFRNELVPQDPDDEPASELLARIRAPARQKQPKKASKKKASSKKKAKKKNTTAKRGYTSAARRCHGV